MLNRPSDNGHSRSETSISVKSGLTYWGKHRLDERPLLGGKNTKLGAGAVPIETTEGWLLIINGVCTHAAVYLQHGAHC